MDTFSKNFSLEGKVALVTGAAYGIGFAIAEAYAKAGAKIAFNCRSQHHMDQALADYKAKGIEAKGYICDVTNEEEVKKMVADIEKELGVIDILVNRDERGGFPPGCRHRPQCSIHRVEGRYPRNDKEGPRQDHQHLLNDERTGS